MPLRCLLILFVSAFAAGCARPGATIELSGPTMGTTYTVKVAHSPAGVDAAAVRATIEEVLAGIDRAMSTYRPDSEVSRFNATASTDWFAVSADLASVVMDALRVSEQSGGAFDITVAPLVSAWGFGPEGEIARMPSDAELQELMERVGYRHLEARAHPAALRKQIPTLTLDLNGIAPGFAVDRLGSRLAALGLSNYLIDIGGEVQAHGTNAQGERWRVAVEEPNDAPPAAYAVVQLDDLAITTSGEYRHYYVRDGQRYSHTIDPRTARPIRHALASVVVAGKSSTVIDAWSTAFNVLGAEAGLALARQRAMPVMFIEWQGTTLRSTWTAPFAPLMVVKPKP